jgi:hypothetical protein
MVIGGAGQKPQNPLSAHIALFNRTQMLFGQLLGRRVGFWEEGLRILARRPETLGRGREGIPGRRGEVVLTILRTDPLEGAMFALSF